MPRNIHGGGARTNENGLRFEQEISLRDALIQSGYKVSGRNNVYDANNNILGKLAPKAKLYSDILASEGINWEDYISKRWFPDEAFLNFSNNTLYIIEKKFQNSSGSVDEKLQTCDFKKKVYQKLFCDTDIRIEYAYVCNDWFRDHKYRDVHEYIESVGCYIFFNEIPLDFLEI